MKPIAKLTSLSLTALLAASMMSCTSSPFSQEIRPDPRMDELRVQVGLSFDDWLEKLAATREDGQLDKGVRVVVVPRFDPLKIKFSEGSLWDGIVGNESTTEFRVADMDYEGFAQRLDDETRYRLGNMPQNFSVWNPEQIRALAASVGLSFPNDLYLPANQRLFVDKANTLNSEPIHALMIVHLNGIQQEDPEAEVEDYINYTITHTLVDLRPMAMPQVFGRSEFNKPFTPDKISLMPAGEGGQAEFVNSELDVPDLKAMAQPSSADILGAAGIGEIEPNGSRSQATTITLGQPVIGAVGGSDAEDWYQFIAPSQGMLGIVVMNTLPTGSQGALAMVQVFNSANQPMSNNGNTLIAGASRAVTAFMLESGQTYSVQVRPAQSQFTVSYALQTSFQPL